MRDVEAAGLEAAHAKQEAAAQALEISKLQVQGRGRVGRWHTCTT